MPIINITSAKGAKSLQAGKYSIIYQAPINCVSATVNARIVSHDINQNIKTRLAIMPVIPVGFTDGGTTPPNAADWISPIDLIIGPLGIQNGVIEDSALVLAPGEIVVAYTDIGLATARVHGLVRTSA